MTTAPTLLKMVSPMLSNDAEKTENLTDIKEISLRQFRRNEYNHCQEANSGRNDTNSITNYNKSKIDKVDKIPIKVDNSEIIVISDDEDALENLKRDVTENMKHIDHEIIELSDDEDPLKIVNDFSKFANQLKTEEMVPNYSEFIKPITTNETAKNDDLQSDSEYSSEPSIKKTKIEESSKQLVEYNINETEFSKVEFGPNYSECLKSISTNEMLSKTEDLQCNSDYSNEASLEKTKTEESSKQLIDYNYNDTECSKVELVVEPNYGECSKTATTNVMLSKNEDLQSNSVNSNTPSLENSKPEESPKCVEYINTECSNEHMIKNTSIKNERPIEELLSNNSESVKMIDTELPSEDLQFKKDNSNMPTETDADEFLKQDPDFNNNECLNELTKFDTNEFTNTTLTLDDYCEGYHSSDFEFIDEDEAKKCPNFLLSLGEAFEKSNSHKFKEPKKINVNKRAAPVKKEAVNKKSTTIKHLENENFSENIEKLATINEANPVLDENENINTGAMDLCRGENEMWYDYLQTLQTPSNEEFNKDYRDNHRIPNDEEYLLLFSGLHSPYLMSAFGANKEINYATNMAVTCQEVGFNVNRFVEDSSPEQRQQAKDTKKKIVTKYSVENRPRRRSSRRF